MIKSAKGISSVPELPCVCGCRDYTLLLKGVRIIFETKQPLDFSILKCNHCGLARTYPIPISSNIKYENPEGVPAIIKNETVTNKDIFTLLASDVLHEIERFKKGGRLLDVGCGAGILLNLAKNKGWRSYGVEVSSGLCAYTQSLGIEMKNAELIDCGLPEGHFDAVSMSQIVEHLAEPLLTLREGAVF